jgi:hypothetical protein
MSPKILRINLFIFKHMVKLNIAIDCVVIIHPRTIYWWICQILEIWMLNLCKVWKLHVHKYWLSKKLIQSSSRLLSRVMKQQMYRLFKFVEKENRLRRHKYTILIIEMMSSPIKDIVWLHHTIVNSSILNE